MDNHTPSLKITQDKLRQARLEPSHRKRFPKQLWKDIYSLSREIPVEILSKELQLNPSFLKRKIQENYEPEDPEFKEVFLEPPETHIVIEISRGELKARIEGPLCCIDSLKSLFSEG